jgi:hypothetical protein
LQLKDDQKQALVAACKSYNRILDKFEEMRQRHEAILEAAFLYQTSMKETAETLFQVRSQVNLTTHLARTHLDGKYWSRILGIG